MNTEQIVKVDDKSQEISLKREELIDIRNWAEHENEKNALKKSLDDQLERARAKHNRELGTIKKERGLAIDKLRKEMLFNIRNVKIQMLSANEDQLQGTTKLTVKQNIQLTSELEYQSQHTEQLTYQNDKMRQQMKLLRIELEEHSEVEKELAKRSHFCNRVINKYKTQIKMLKEEIQEREQAAKAEASESTSQYGRSDANVSRSTFGGKGKQPQNYKSDLTQFLQKRILDMERKQQEAQNQLDEIR